MATKGRDSERRNYGSIPTKYSKKLTPDEGLYMRSLYGTDADKANYAADMKSKIEAANKWRDQKMQFYAVNKEQERRFNQGGNR